MKIGYLVAFAAGAGIGVGASWFLLKKKYEKIAQEEIDSVKEVYSKREASSYILEEDEQDEEESSEENKSMMEHAVEYAKQLNKHGYTNYSDAGAKIDIPKAAVDAPYVIAPDEVGLYDDYDEITLTYYADHILADDMDEIVEDVEEKVGYDALTHFGQYEEDCVYVRNDKRKVDYEIVLDERTYAEVVRDNPFLR